MFEFGLNSREGEEVRRKKKCRDLFQLYDAELLSKTVNFPFKEEQRERNMLSTFMRSTSRKGYTKKQDTKNKKKTCMSRIVE